jgi:3-deoxy-D-manno-octulosonate 8-phosphate phosphatase KdsC-like HAD superfamily phosphatase
MRKFSERREWLILILRMLGTIFQIFPSCGAVVYLALGNAVPEVKKTAHYVTKASAGHGAIPDTVELVLKPKGIWEAMIDKARA